MSPTKALDLSIIILTWNTADITRKCVDSIKKNLTSIKYQIIIADNGSTDNTKNLFSHDRGVTYVDNGANLGFAKGNNLAAKHARGKYLLFLNSDMELLDDSLSQMLLFLKQNPNIGLIGPAFLNIDHTPQGSVFPPQNIINAFKEFWLGQKAYSKYVPSQALPTPVWSISGGALLIDKDLFIKIGGWDEKYYFYYEDMELCRQVRNLDYKIYFYPLCKIVHRHGFSGKNLTDQNNQWRRLIPSSKKYHGLLKHIIINIVIWSGQKYRSLISKR